MSSDKIILRPNLSRDVGMKCTLEAKKLLEDAGHKVVISPAFETDEIPSGVEIVPMESVVEQSKLIVSFGGDGTILHTARAAIGCHVPIIGVNLGTKGFLAELEPDELHWLLKAAKGEFTPEYRMMLDVRLERKNAETVTGVALNDVVISGIARTIHLKAWGDGQLITEFSGDGVILATPTGSTAYSMSAGGPLVEPTAENIILTPVCAHALAARSFVLEPSRTVRVQISRLDDQKRVFLSVDGGSTIALGEGDELHVSRSEYRTLIAHVSGKSFYDVTYDKLGE